jgi:transcription initiation factor TFIIIB Brf1 subunit/transcription initiation factor TFIIB
MSGALTTNISRNVCSHDITVDTPEDECVCTQCGLVLLQVYSPTTWTNVPPTDKTKDDTIDYIRDVGDRACISANIVLHAENYYEKIKATLLPKFRKKTIATYALYESLNAFEVPRMAAEIEHYSGVSMKHIWDVESSLSLENSLNDPINYVHRYCVLLNFSYVEQLTVKNTVWSIQCLPLGNLRCNCLVAVIIYLFCKEEKKKITLRKICETCNISATSVHRVIRQFSNHIAKLQDTPELCWIVKHVNCVK